MSDKVTLNWAPHFWICGPIQGNFTVLLPPDEYTIVPDASAPILFPEQQTKVVTVPEDGFADVTLRFDTGIR